MSGNRDHHKNSHEPGAWSYIFDDFEVDSANRKCSRRGVELPISGKVLDVLLVFVESPGRLLTKDELIESVWPDEFVEEGNLARNVSTLRKALGDTEKHHRYIATVPGHGYRFIADVTTAEASNLTRQNLDNAAAVESNTFDQTGERTERHRETGEKLYARPVLVLAVLACLLIGLLVAFSLSKRRMTLADAFTFERLRQSALTQDGNVFGALISHDGKYLAYSRLAGHERALCLRQISTGSVLELRPPEPATSYWANAFSPDDQFLYYILKEKEAESGSIYRIPVIGQQAPTKIADRANGGLTISPDGKTVAFTRADREAGLVSIVTVSTKGENERVIGSTDYESAYFSLDWSPDGQSFIYSKRDRTANSENWYIAEVPASGGPETRIGPGSPTPILGVKWLSDKSGLIVNAVDEVTHKPQIFAMSYPEGELRRVTQDMNSYIGFSVTSDGKTIVVPQINSSRQIWSFTGPTSRATQVSDGTEKHFDNVVWRGNEELLFDEDEGGSFSNYNIYSMRLDGSDITQLTSAPGSSSNPTISADGQTVAYVSNRSGTRQLWKMDADGRNAVQLTFLPNDVLKAAILPDGKQILFSVFNSGKATIWSVSTDGGEPRPMIGPDVSLWAVSPGGDRIAFVTIDPVSKLESTHIRSVGKGADLEVINISPETFLAWGIDGRSLYYNSGDDNATNVWKTTLDQEKSEPVTNFEDEQVYSFAWSPDGKTLACIRHRTSYDALILHFE